MGHPEVRLDHACVSALEEVEGGRHRQVERGVADAGYRCGACQLLLRLDECRRGNRRIDRYGHAVRDAGVGTGQGELTQRVTDAARLGGRTAHPASECRRHIRRRNDLALTTGSRPCSFGSTRGRA